MKIQVEEDARARIERACERLVIEFALLNDLGDNDGVAALFAANGTYERPMAPGQAISGREAILASLKARDPRFSRHIVTNILVDVISNDRAKGRSYVTFMSTTNVSAPRPVTAEPYVLVGEYDDEFVLTQGGWKFAVRRGRMALRGVLGTS